MISLRWKHINLWVSAERHDTGLPSRHSCLCTSAKSSHLSNILGLTAQRNKKLPKDRVRGLHIHITQKNLSTGSGLVSYYLLAINWMSW